MWCYVSLFFFVSLLIWNSTKILLFSGKEKHIIHYISSIESNYLGKVDEVHLHVNEKHSSAAPRLTGSSPFPNSCSLWTSPSVLFLFCPTFELSPKKNPLHKSSRFSPLQIPAVADANASHDANTPLCSGPVYMETAFFENAQEKKRKKKKTCLH